MLSGIHLRKADIFVSLRHWFNEGKISLLKHFLFCFTLLSVHFRVVTDALHGSQKNETFLFLVKGWFPWTPIASYRCAVSFIRKRTWKFERLQRTTAPSICKCHRDRDNLSKQRFTPSDTLNTIITKLRRLSDFKSSWIQPMSIIRVMEQTFTNVLPENMTKQCFKVLSRNIRY